jgi:TorA-specific chaperone
VSVFRRGAIGDGDEVSAGIAHWLADLFVAPQTVEAIADYRSDDGDALLAAMGEEAGFASYMDKMRTALCAGNSAAAIARDLSLAYTLLFEGVSGSATVSLYQSTYTGAFNRLYQQPADDMALLLQRSNLSISRECCESPDHLSIELALLSAVLRAGDSAGIVLVRDQLLAWVPRFAAACGRLDPTGFYGDAARAVNEFLACLAFPQPSNAVRSASPAHETTRS